MRFFAVLCLLMSTLLSAQTTLELIEDINPGSADSRVSATGAALGDLLVFPATTPTNGTELWISDGTEAGTQLLVDLLPGAGSSSPEDLYAADGLVYFHATTPTLGRELYVTDGTAAGTRLVRDIYPGGQSGFSSNVDANFFAWRNNVYFVAQNTDNNYELWRTDGSTANTVQVANLALPSFGSENSSFPESFAANEHWLYFTADDDQVGREVWRTDGTNLSLVDDLNNSFSGSDPQHLIAVGDYVYFSAETGFANDNLYRSLATPGSARSIELVFDFNGQGLDLSTNFSGPAIVELNGSLIFAADHTSGPDLWISDGTTAGTRVLLDAEESGFGGYTPQQLTKVDGLIYYKDEIPGTGVELWVTDGTSEGTLLVEELRPGFSASIFLPSFLHGHQGVLYFGAEGDVVDGFGNTGIELYQSGGTAETTGLTADINDGSDDSRPNNFVSVGDLLFFFADNGSTGQELYVLSVVQPLTLEAAAATNVSCFGEADGSVTLTAGGGTPPYRFGEETNETGEFTITDLVADDYVFTVTDAEDSTATISVTITQPNNLQLVASNISPETADGGGSIALLPLGGTRPYAFSWADTTLTTNIRRNLAAGTYFATLTDGNGCMAMDSFVVEDFRNVRLISAEVFDVRCHGGDDGAVILQVGGGSAPYTINGAPSETGDASFFGLQAGMFVVTVTDSRDSTTSFTFDVAEPAPLEFVVTTLTGQNSIEGGTIELMPTGGTPPYAISWADTTLTDTIRQNLPFGTYVATLTDDNFCRITDTFLVEDLTPVNELLATDFSVYPTLVTSALTIEMTAGTGIDRVVLHDLSGKLVSSTRGLGQTQLTLGGEALPAAGGTYLVSVWTTDGQRGTVRIIRQG